MRQLDLTQRFAFTVDEVASLLGIHPETVRREIRAGRLSAIRVNRKLLIPSKNLIAYLEAPHEKTH